MYSVLLKKTQRKEEDNLEDIDVDGRINQN